MIKRLKRKIILLASVSMLALMTLLLGLVNAINYSSVLRECDRTLDVLAKPNTPFFGNMNRPDTPNTPDVPQRNLEKFLPRGMSPEVPYEARFFTVTVDSDGSVVKSDISRIVSVDDAAVSDYVAKAVKKGNARGFVEQFRYLAKEENGETRYIFLDCGRKIDAFRQFLWISAAVGFAGCVLVFLLFLLIAGRIIRPIAESYEKQKRFITDAGHEIKTPLTIIAANVDLLEAENGSCEAYDDIRGQTRRLTGLTNDLVYLSRMEEADRHLAKIDFPLSDLAAETAAPFRAVAAAQKKQLETEIAPNLSYCGAPDALRQLMSILLDNALKYSSEEGWVRFALSLQKKAAVLCVSNLCPEPLSEVQCERLFDRFYRTDASRNSERGGHGIGLSIARAVTEAHGGKIGAAWKDSVFSVTVVLPV